MSDAARGASCSDFTTTGGHEITHNEHLEELLKGWTERWTAVVTAEEHAV